MINIRKLAAADMLIHGTRFILAEYALGIILPLVFGSFSIRNGLAPTGSLWETLLGIWLVSVAPNYLPLFIYAVLLARGGTARQEGQLHSGEVRQYNLQQGIIMIPMFVVILSLVQEFRHR